MSAQELSDMVYAIKEKITDKEFKDIMDKLSVKNKEENKPELYEFTYMKMKEPTLVNNGYSFLYNFAYYKIKTKDVVFETGINQNDQFKKEFLSNKNCIHIMPFMLTKSKTHNYHVLSEGCGGMCDNSVIDMYCKNPLANEDSDDDDDDCECGGGCDKCMYSILKKQKGAEIRYRKMIGLSIKKK